MAKGWENIREGDMSQVELPPAQTAAEQRREFFDRQLRDARILLGMQKGLSLEQQEQLLADTKRKLNEYLDYEEIEKRGGLSEDDMKFLASAENPYTFMAMSVKEKERFYELSAKVREIKGSMREGGSKTEAEKPEHKNPYLELRDKSRDHATPMQKRIGEIQGAKYETALYQLMERSGDNSELINAMNEFLNELGFKASYGNSNELLPEIHQKQLAEFFRKQTEELRNLWGNKSKE